MSKKDMTCDIAVNIEENHRGIDGINVSPTKSVRNKKHKCLYKFDIKKVIKKRKGEIEHLEKMAVLDEKNNIADELFDPNINDINQVNEPKPKVIESRYIIFDQSKYNLLSKANDTTNFYLQKFFQLSIEENVFEAAILFNTLMVADWSPIFDDIQNVFYNWGTDADTFLNMPVMQEIDQKGIIGWHNFEFVMTYISHCINNKLLFSHSDLLTLAKFIVTIAFDSHCGEMTFAMKEVFNYCIEKTLSADNDDSIIAFAEELYSKYTEDELMKIVVCLFLPLEGHTMTKMYCYLSFKLFKSFIGCTNNVNEFPSTINDWFVQDMAPREYFKQNPKKVQCVIKLLNHIVFVLNLYENEEKLQIMHDYLYSLARSFPFGYINILDQWKLKLFRLKVIRINNSD